MKIALLTNEYPPYVYGGAGVHAEYLSRELSRLDPARVQVEVLCFGDQEIRDPALTVTGVKPRFELPSQDPRFAKFMDTLLRDLVMAGSVKEAGVVHCHTWYSHFAGCLLKQLLRIPLVLTTHSLEPHRPWKVEQLGAAYQASTWLEKTAYENADGVIAVSESMKQDVHDLYGVPFEKIRVIPNGIDLDEYRPRRDPALLRRFGIDPEKPFILFVGRITRQKGIIHLVDALRHLNPGVQAVLCAGAPDTPEIGADMKERVEAARRVATGPLVWIPEMLKKEEVIALYSQAALFVCPSVYEPFGIINLEAMACHTPVVASAVGGIKEVVVDGETGVLVPFEPVSETDFAPRDPQGFSLALARAINALLENPARLDAMADKARARVEAFYSWTQVARRTHQFYEELIAHYGR